MKNVYFFLIQALIALSLVCVTGCSKDDPSNSNSSVPDPEGTVTANISENRSIMLSANTYSFGIGWTEPNNFWLGATSICDMGAMKGLGNITKIPQTGYTSDNTTVACQVGHGYVVVLGPAYAYARLYVVSSLVNTSGGIMGATVKYQYPFNP